MTICGNINRLDLHDAQMESVTRTDNNISMVCDWAKLDDYQEGNIDEPIILGKTIIEVIKFSDEELRNYIGETNYVQMQIPSEMENEFGEVGYCKIDEQSKSMSIFALSAFTINEKYLWLGWRFKYESITISWDSFVTKTEWLNGALPID